MKLALIFYLSCLTTLAYGQMSISGKVISAVNNTPVTDASVYINNTSVGTITDANGAFSIKTTYNGRIELVISHTSFQKKIITLTAGPIPVNLTISLEPKTNVLDEVVIVNDPLRGWRKWHKLFTDYFMGTSSFARKCTIKNPEVLKFSYDRAGNQLKVTSRSTLVVENRALGYTYKIDLNLFKYSFSTLELKSDITVFFLEIKPANEAEQKLFTQNRNIAFRGSKMDFIRALYNKDYNKKDFSVVAIHATPNLQKRRIAGMISDAIAQAYLENRNINTVTLASIAKGDKDTVAFYEQKLAEPDYVIKDTSSVSLNDHVTISADRKGVFQLTDTLLIQYSANVKEPAFRMPVNSREFTLGNIETNGRNNSRRPFQYTFMTLKGANQMTIYPDGGYDGDLFTKGCMDGLKVAGLLPWDYKDTQPLISNKVIEDEETAFSPDSVHNDKAIKNILDKLKGYLTEHIIEKVYLQTDRPYYTAGDTIYFKAYVTTGEQHVLSPVSKVLHVDLINANNHIERSIKLQLNNGLAWGDLALPDSIENGRYKIRAYTRLMENDAQPAYFEKNLPVANVKQIRVPESGQNRSQSTYKIDVQFFPEGGGLITGIKSKVAFKAINADGLGIDVKGRILDNDGRELCSFVSEHLGMGYFYLEPQTNKSYKAEVTYSNNLKISIDLPKPAESGMVFSINNSRPGKAVATIKANEAFFRANKDKSYSLIAYSGGEAMPFVFSLEESSVSVDIDTYKLHSGVATATLFSSDAEPLAERLFFVKNGDLLDLNINSNKTVYAKREKAKIDLHVQSDGLPVGGHFSVSVIDGGQVTENENAEHTILTDLLLTSDIKGYVEQPNYYFNSPSKDAAEALDILMLTQGYRRFQWKSVSENEMGRKLSFQPETSLEAEGRLTTPAGKPVAGGKVVFMDGKDGIVLDTTTDETGRFKFSDLSVADTSTVIISAHKANNNPDVKVTIEPDQIPAVTAMDANSFAIPQQYQELAQVRYKELQMRKRTSLPGIINLKTVQISGHRDRTVSNLKHSANLNGPGHADYVIMGNQLNNCADIACLFGKLPGTISKGGKLYLARTAERLGKNQGMGAPPIAIILDGVPIADQKYVFDMVNVPDIHSIELLSSGAYLALYGSQAGGGAILITTKRGGEAPNSPGSVSRGLIKFQMNGFYKARQFYSPIYDHPQNTGSKDLRQTIYWNPELTTDKDGNLSFEYYNSDGQGPCRVIIEGIDDHGNVGRQVFRYEIQ